MVAASNTANGQPTLDSFLAQATFSVDLCNTVLVMWILLHALPFNRFYDSPLRAAFKLANRRAELRTPTWAAGVAKELYFSLSSAAVSMVQVSTIIFPKFHVIQFFFLWTSSQENRGKFSLVHDVWTTKGNRYAFIGVSANLIDNDWNYQTIHLTLKLVAWNKSGHLLAKPVARFLIGNRLYKKISRVYFLVLLSSV